MNRAAHADELAIIRQIEREHQNAQLALIRMSADLDRRDLFWRGVGLVVAGTLIMLGSRKGKG